MNGTGEDGRLRGEEKPDAKLTADAVREARERYRDDDDVTLAELGEDYGVHERTVKNAICGDSWTHVGGPIAGEDYCPVLRCPGQAPGPEHPNYVPTEELLDDVIAGRVALGVWPSNDDYHAFGTHASDTLRKRFGSFPDALEAAKRRLEANRDEWDAFVDDDPDAAGGGPR